LQPEERHSAFHLLLPAEAFTVDPPELRKEAGPDFASVPSLADIQGTRNNMLGSKVLNAEQYPEIEIWSERIRGPVNSLTADIVVAVGGKLNRITIPIKIETADNADNTITARGKFTVKQTDIGITPFSIMMGAVAVRDELEIEYIITANIN
jgi:polyisoprenoid-binding protein YceI